jgi:predicted permease
MPQWWSKLLAVFTRDTRDDDLRAELDAHLQMEADANLDRGMTPQDALDTATRQFGNRTAIHESSREAWMFLWLETLLQDLRYGLRALRRLPGFALTAISVIALGIGATTAAFTLLDHVLLRPLPFPQPEQLVRLFETELANGYPRIEASPPNILDWRSMTMSFSSMGAFSTFSVNLSGQGDPLRLNIGLADSLVFKALEVQPAAGRSFTADDDRMGAADVALLSHSLAITLYGDAPGAVGRTLNLDNQAHTVIGVMPAGFVFPSRDTALWTPIPLSPELLSLRRNHLLDVVARLAPGVTIEQARADMDVVAQQLQRAYPNDNAGIGAAVVDMRDLISPQSRMLVLGVFGAAFCLLLIACTNLANLLFARAMARRQEIAVRVAIGAARGRLVRQLLTESLLLATLGGALGALLALVTSPLLERLVPSALPIGGTPAMDMRVLGVAALLTLMTSVAFGVGPALRSCRTGNLSALRSRTAAGGPIDRLRSALVLAEIVGTVALLVGAGLLVKALWRVQAVDPGFRAEGVLTLRTALPMPKYGEAAARREFYARVLTAARALPGVTSAGYTTALPMIFGAGIFPVTVPGIVTDPASAPRVSIRYVTPDFFATLGIPLRQGRYIGDRDGATTPFVALISESLVQRLWPGQDPVGRTLTLAGAERTVVGVVGDVAVRGLERISEPQTYMPVDQMGFGGTFYAPKDLVVRSSDDPVALVPAIRKIIQEIDPEQPVSNVRLLEDIVASQTGARRDQLMVLGTFAGIAFLLAAVGIHGLLSFTVSARTQEVGVRVALGAARGTILGMFMRQGLTLGMIGVAVALPLAYLGARGMRAVLFGVEPGDPIIYGAAALLALVMTVAGSLRPALRAATIDPAVTIRTE